MIKLHSQGTASDYTEHGSVSTDCVTVGEFMTEAASIYGGILTIEVDGCRYEFNGHPKIMVTDETPVGDITYACAPGNITFIVKTKPKSKTVNQSGWINIFRISGKRIINGLYDSKEEAGKAVGISDEFHVATVRVEWEEVPE